ncbi:hypothetical protein WR25_27235 isoform D [Diploscapter pachys]|nr:hypothetical protein WR25_27235 isoform D [Diploscapter pachys]
MKQAFENEKDPHKKSRIYHSCVDQLHQNGIVYQGQFMGGQGNMPLGANEMDRSMVSNVPYQMSRIPPGQMPPNHQMGGPAPPPTTNPAMMAAYAQQTAPFTPAKVAISAQLQAQQAQAIPSTGPGSVGSMSQVAPSMMPNMSMPSQMPPGQNMQNAAYGMRPGMPQSIPSSVPPASMNQMLSVPSPAPQIGSVGSHPSAMAHSPAVASVGPASQSQQPQSQQPHTPQNPASVQQPASVPAPNSTGQPGSVSAPNSVADPETTAIIAKVSELYSDKLNKIVQRCKDDEETVPVAILRLMEILEGKRIYAQISRLENLAKEALDKFGLSASIGNTMKDVIRKKEKRESDVAPPELTVNNAPIPSAQPVKVDVWNRRIKTKGICIPDAVLSLFDDGSTAEKTILSESFDSSGRLLVVPLNSSGAGQVDASTPSRKRKASPEPEINDKRQRTDSGNTTNPTVHFVDTPKRLMKSEGNEAAAPSGNAQPAAADPNSPATSSGASTERIKIECSADTRTPWMMSAVASQELEGLSWRVDPDRRPMSSLSPDVVLCFESKSIACPPLRLLIPASYPLEPAIVQYDRTFPPNIAISRQLAAVRKFLLSIIILRKNL